MLIIKNNSKKIGEYALYNTNINEIFIKKKVQKYVLKII